MNNQASATRGRPQPTAATPPNARDPKAHNHTTTQSTPPAQESRSGSGPRAGNPNFSSLEAERPLQASTTTRNPSVVQESKSELKAGNTSSTDYFSDTQTPIQAGRSTPSQNNTYSFSSNTQKRPQASNTTTTRDISVVQELKSKPRPGNLLDTNPPSLNAERLLQASTATTIQNTSVLQESKSGLKAGNPLSTSPFSFNAQAPIQVGRSAPGQSNMYSFSSDTQGRLQANTTTTMRDVSTVQELKSGPRASNLLDTDPSSSNAQKPTQASTPTILRSSTDPSSSNDHRPPRADKTTTSSPPPPQQSNLNTDIPSKVSSSSNTGGEQPRTQNHNPPPRDEGLYTTVEMQEQRLKTLEDKLDKLNEEIHSKEEKRWTFQLWPVMAASYHYHSPTRTVGTPGGDIETPVEELGPKDTTGTQSREREAETMGNQPLSAHKLQVIDRDLPEGSSRMSIAVTGNTTGPNPIPISREPEYPCKAPRDPNPVPNPNADVEKLRLQKLVVGLTAKQEVLQSENNRLSATVSSLEKRSLNYEYLLASHEELDAKIKMHRCPTGDELDCPNSKLRLDFEDFEMGIEELIDNCDTSSIDLKTILHMSRSCLADTVPSWWDRVVDEEKKKLWLRGLLANVLHAEFFERSFYSDLDGKGRLESGFIDFENLIFRENSGVEKRVALEWRARTFRLAAELMNTNENSRNTRVRKVFEALKAIFEDTFDTNADPDFDHVESLREICEKALHCSSLLRRSTSIYTWDQQRAPRSITGPGVSLEKIRTTGSSNGALVPPFNVFAEVLKLRRNNAIEQILKPTVAVFSS